MGIANHRADIIRVDVLEKHNNADALSIVRIGGYQVVVRTDSWKVGDLAVYIQPDSVVPVTKPFEFLWANMTFPDDIVPERAGPCDRAPLSWRVERGIAGESERISYNLRARPICSGR